VKAEWGLGSKLLSELFVGENAVMSAEAFGAYQLSGANAVDALKILDAAIAIDVTPLLSKIQCPTLVVHNREDRVIPMEYAQDLAAGIKGARFVSFPGGHIPPVDAILASQKAVTDFIRGDAARAQATTSSDSTFRTVLFTDIVGHTEMMRRLGDDKGRAVLREHEQVTRDVLKANAGSEVKTMGDGFMASFTSVTKAVECAIALQRGFDQRNASAAEPVTIRVGLNAGEPIQEDGPDGRSDLFGETVILAARIAAQANGDEILASMAVRELCAGKGFLFADVGEKAMRGFEDPVRVFEVRWRP
jgi:class 3 adenylate cyclase